MAALHEGEVVGSRLETYTHVPPRHPLQWVAAGLVAIAGGLLALSIGTNENMRWDVVADYMFNPQVLDGVVWTVALTLSAMGIAIVLGIAIALMRISSNRFLQTAAVAYLWFFRGTPLLVQLIFWFNLALVFPQLGLPMFFGPDAHGGIDTNAAISWFVAALLGFGLHEAAYMSEVVRSGFLSIDRGQTEAAEALGMTSWQTLRRIILPQAMRVIVPPTVNQFVNLLKATSLVAFIAGEDLLSSVQTIYARNYLVIPLLVVASIWYLALVTVASIAQNYVEKRLGRGYGRTSTASADRQEKTSVAPPGGPGEAL
jgi:polar amino acid transport system permease protein